MGPSWRIFCSSKKKKNYTVHMPIVVISKIHGYTQKGILVPNVYFGKGDLLKWHYESRFLWKTVGRKLAFEERDKRIFWRGAILNLNQGCELDRGNFERLEAASLTVKYPRLFDIRCHHSCSIHNYSLPYRTSKNKECYASWQKNMKVHATTINLSTVPNAIRLVQDDEYRDDSYFANYRGVLSLPGKISDGYSKSLNKYWGLGAVVFIWQHEYVEFYYPQLIPGKTHLILNSTNALDQASLILNRSSTVDTLIQGALNTAKSVVCASCLALYLKDFFISMRKHFRMDLVFDNAAALNKVFQQSQINCHKDFVELFIADGPIKKHNHLKMRTLPPAASCKALLRDYFKLS
uniref:Uncharacterized protein n=1 Tax=Aureoumbra lagunensis TaxID=44058 RepID=A0A7S3JY32_9STRA